VEEALRIPKLDSFEDPQPGPGWVPITQDGRPVRPVLRCGGCGMMIGIRGHAISADGHVTPSVHHVQPPCGWHVFVVLDGYDGPEFPRA
jgi:hypothetical protein